MTSPSRAPRRRLVVAGILAVGWGAAAAIYVAAPAVDENPDVYDLEHSREYERQVEVLGGKATLLATELDRWLASFWQGRSLAYTVAFLAAAVALGYWLWDRYRGAGGGGIDPPSGR